MSKPRLIIADDHTLMMDGLRRLLEPEYEVVATAVNGRQLLETLAGVAADAVILDIAMPELNGIEAARLIAKSWPGTRIVFVTQQIDRHYVLAAFRAGAVGFVAKQAASDELKIAIRDALRGHSYITPMIKLDGAAFPPGEGVRGLLGGELTPRQREVLQLTAEGKTVKEIGATLKISPKTVEFHKSAIMDQLGLRNTADLTRYAILNGISTSSALHW